VSSSPSPTPLCCYGNPLLLALLTLALAACAADSGPPATADQAPSSAAAEQATNTINIGTGGATGVYYPAGGGICRMFNRNRGQQSVTCAVESTEGSIANIEGLRAGEFDMVIVQSDWQFHAYQGDGPFAKAGPYRDLRAVFSLHAEPFTVVARADSGITSVADLRGKRVNVGSPGSGQRATTEAVMAANGWTMADFAQAFELPSEQQAAALADGRVDAIVFTVGHPSGEIYDATESTSARLVPITGPAVDSLIADTPYYAEAVIPGGLYRGNDSPTPTFGVRATLLTTATTPDDVVYLVVKSVFENFEEFKRLHPALAQLDQGEMARAALTAPLHPGAERYYREAGMM
jgi:TRAP transporter TAXI family solute receptor